MKTVLITGASSGIGAACAKLFAKNYENVNLILLARRQNLLEGLQAEISGINSKAKVHVFALDLSLENKIQEFANREKALLSSVDILINSAGLAKGVDMVQNANFDHWNEMLNVNIKGLFSITHKLLPYLVQRPHSHIVNIGSVAGLWTYPGGAVYCATKAAVKSFSEGLRLDLIGKPVRVTNIEPGMVESEFSEVRFENDKAKAKSVYANMKPLTPEDIAETIHWCTSLPKHVNIQELVVFPTDQAGVGHVHRRV